MLSIHLSSLSPFCLVDFKLWPYLIDSSVMRGKAALYICYTNLDLLTLTVVLLIDSCWACVKQRMLCCWGFHVTSLWPTLFPSGRVPSVSVGVGVCACVCGCKCTWVFMLECYCKKCKWLDRWILQSDWWVLHVIVWNHWVILNLAWKYTI